jgi:hypothetical protein
LADPHAPLSLITVGPAASTGRDDELVLLFKSGTFHHLEVPAAAAAVDFDVAFKQQHQQGQVTRGLMSCGSQMLFAQHVWHPVKASTLHPAAAAAVTVTAAAGNNQVVWHLLR